MGSVFVMMSPVVCVWLICILLWRFVALFSFFSFVLHLFVISRFVLFVCFFSLIYGMVCFGVRLRCLVVRILERFLYC